MLKYNTHCHSAGTSSCGVVPPDELVRAYRRAGYDGLYLTNHYSRRCAECYLAGDSPEQKAETFLAIYREAKRAGDACGLDVRLGMELNLSRYNRKGNTYPVYEFLIFGLTESFVRENPTMYEWTQEEAYERFDREGMLMIQTHPFRPRTRVADPFFEHGIEVFNGHPEHDSHNDLAMGFASAHPELLTTAGDDFHRPDTQGYAGMFFPEGEDPCDSLRRGTARIFTTGKSDPSIVRKNR